MAWAKGESGNKNGRPKLTDAEKQQKAEFQRLLKSSTVGALESIIQIANDRYNKDRFNACKFIIEKAYGANTAFLLDDSEEENKPLIVHVVPYKEDDEEDWNTDEEDWEREWNNTPEESEE